MCDLTLSEVKDIITMLVSISATVIAFFGLRTWRKKLLGENKYELSINVLKTLRILIDEIENFRNPIRLTDEIYIAYKEITNTELDSQNKKEFERAEKFAENLRWNKVISAFIEYDSKVLHLKVILDDYKMNVINEITMTNYIKELRNSMYACRRYNELLNHGTAQSQEERKNYIDEVNKHSLILYKYEQTNDFSKAIENYFIEIKKRLKKYLR